MTQQQETKIRELVDKYNDILLVSMKLAIAEDLINLMVLNRDDSEFVMKDLFENKEEFYNIIMKEFFTKNSSSVIKELKHMEHYKPKMNSKRKG
jgi:hypothetical protein